VITNIPLDKYEEFYVCDGHVYLQGEGVEGMLLMATGKWRRKLLESRMQMPEQKLRTLIRKYYKPCPSCSRNSSNISEIHPGMSRSKTKNQVF
jgi:hypothetical protein